MAAVLIQVNLPGSRPRDYNALAELLTQSGWRTQVTGDDGKPHQLAPGTFIGSHADIGKLAEGLRMKLRDSGLHEHPTILTAVIQDWTAVSG